MAGEVERARGLLDELERALSSRGEVPGQAHALWYLALTAWRAGSWEDADRYAADALELTVQVGIEADQRRLPVGDPRRASGARRPCTRAGTRRDRPVQDAGDAHRRAGVQLGARRRRARARRPGRSVAHTCGALTSCATRPSCSSRPCASSWAISSRRSSPRRSWRRPIECSALVEARARALDRTWALAVIERGRGLVLATRGDLDGAFAAFELALGEHARVTDPFQHARTLLALGRTQRRAKQRAAARATLEDALARFETLGARLWAEQTRAELARIGGRTASRGELTEAERRIALLVAEGRRNREVAAELYLTEHSVETALTRIYRKLGIRSRGELGRALSKS